MRCSFASSVPSPLEKYDAAFNNAAGCAHYPSKFYGQGAKAEWDTYYGCAGPAAKWQSQNFQGGGEMHDGKDNVRRWLTELWIYDDASIEVEEIVDLADGALGITRFHGSSADAPPVDFPWCHLIAFRDGRISQAHSFLDRAEARKAAGLSA